MRLAATAASMSRDPSTQVGAVIVRPDKTIASTGFNGFPRGVDDSPARYEDRDLKYRLVVHAELNAIVSARTPLDGCVLYATLQPCCECAKAIVQAGIAAVVALPPFGDAAERWKTDHAYAALMFREAGVAHYIVLADNTLVRLDAVEADAQ